VPGSQRPKDVKKQGRMKVHKDKGRGKQTQDERARITVKADSKKGQHHLTPHSTLWSLSLPRSAGGISENRIQRTTLRG